MQAMMPLPPRSPGIRAAVLCLAAACVVFAAAPTLRAIPEVLPPVVPPPGQVFIETASGKYLPVNYDLAIKLYTQNLARDPHDFDTCIRRAVAEGLKHEYVAAIADYKNALSLDPRYSRSFYSAQSLRRDGTTPDFLGALADCNATLVQDPQNLPALLNRAIIRYLCRDSAGALTTCNLALALDPHCAFAYYFRAAVRNSESNESMADFTQAVTLDPKLALAWFARGSLWLEHGGPGPADHAIADFTQALALDPQMAAAHRERGTAKYRKRDFDGAIADATEAFALNPQDTAALVARSDAKILKKDYPAAIADCDAVLAIDPDNFLAYNNRGEAETFSHKEDLAIADFNWMIDHGKMGNVPIYLRAVAEKSKGDYPAAVADFTATGSYDERARVEILQKNYAAAIADLTQVINRNTRSSYVSELLTYRAQAEQAKGDQDAATADFAKAHALNKNLGQ